MEMTLAWKPDWDRARVALLGWWNHTGLALSVTAPREKPIEDLPAPDPHVPLETRWLDPAHRVQSALHAMARTFYGGAAFPILDNLIGPGSLGMFLDCGVEFAPDTVWYHPSIAVPEQSGHLRFDPQNKWYQAHLALTQAALDAARGRYIVGYPDLIENLDILAQLRGPQETLMDLVERPEWALEKIWEINEAFCAAYDALYPLLADPWGGTTFCAFQLWAPGRVAKVQCDSSCMISAADFRKLVQPALEAQCDWLDYSMYHLDGTQAMHQLDNLLSIDSLDAIEWTPQAEAMPGGGSPQWYDLYKRIKAAGKSVQAIGVKPEELQPLLDAVGPEGMYVMMWVDTEREARRILDQHW
jgi:hypothetical protein